MKNVLKKITIVTLSTLSLVSAPQTCFAAHHKSRHTTTHSVKFFPMTKRKFLIDKNMVEKIVKSRTALLLTSDFDELVGMLNLEAIQILDIGDPYRIIFKTRKDFDGLYRKYAEFSQILSSLKICGITIKERLPYLSTVTTKSAIPIRREKYTLQYVEPFRIFAVNYWLKVPIEVTLNPDLHLTAKEIIDWSLGVKFATCLANNRLTDLCAYNIMHELWAILPNLFPEV